jgi:multidrug transporter EmrE-like cation transporter
MRPALQAIPLILAGVLLNALAQIPLKKGVQAAGGVSFALGPLVKLFLQPWVLLGIACYVVSLAIWLGALSKVDVNFAYPFLALGFLANALLARWVLGEPISPLRWVALGVIVLGVALQALSGLQGRQA